MKNAVNSVAEATPGSKLRARLDSSIQLQRVVSDLLLPLNVAGYGDQSFRAVVESVGGVRSSVGRVRSTPHVVRRENGASSDPDLFKITLHLRGTASVSQDDGPFRKVSTGDVLLLDTTRPYKFVLPDNCDVVVLGLPRELAGAHERALARHSGVSLSTDVGIRSLCAALLTKIGDDLHGVFSSPRAADHVIDGLVSLVIGAYAEVSMDRVERPSTALFEIVVAYALANLGDPDLDIERVAERHHYSTRRVQQVFQDHGLTFRAWVRRERLVRIRRDLSDPSLRHRSVADIAGRWGWRDFRHLARDFRAAYGCTPRDLRHATEGPT